MLVAVIISHRLSPRTTAQFGAEGKCSENIFATMRSEAIRNKPATRNRIVRMGPILRTEVDGSCSAPNVWVSYEAAFIAELVAPSGYARSFMYVQIMLETAPYKEKRRPK